MAFPTHRRELHLSWMMPSLLVFVSALLGNTPVPFGIADGPMPSFALIAVFFWSLLRPEYLPYWVLFLCGLCLDALLGLPLGVHALLLILLRFTAARISYMFVRRSVWVYWLGFAGVSLGFWAAYWLMLTLLLAAPLAPEDAILHWLITVLCYPFLHLIFVRLLVFVPPTR